MIDAIQLLGAALPYVGILLLFAAWWRAGNMTVTLQWAAKTSEPERDTKLAKMRAERDEARKVAESLRGGA